MPSYTAKELERETGVDRRTIAYYVQEGLLPKVGRRGRRTRYPKLFRDRLLFIQRVRDAEEEGHVSAVSLSDIRKVFERVPPALIAGVADGRIAVTPDLVSEPSTAFRTPGMRQAILRERWVGEERATPPARSPPPPAAPPYSPGAPAEEEDLGEDVAGPHEGDVLAREEEPPEPEPGPYAAEPGPDVADPGPYPAEPGPYLSEPSEAEQVLRSFVQREVDVPPVYSRLPETEAEAEAHAETDRAAGRRHRVSDLTGRHVRGTVEALALARILRELEEVARRRNEESPRSRNTWTRIDVSPNLVLSARGIGEEDAELVEWVRRAIRGVMGRG